MSPEKDSALKRRLQITDTLYLLDWLFAEYIKANPGAVYTDLTVMELAAWARSEGSE